VPVSRLAKWKTTFQLVALGALILGGAVNGPPCELRLESCVPRPDQGIHLIGLSALWAAAILTLITGWDYLRVGLRHMD
jgi:CDP-diacylglycerol--glycerol-3-phosphate 3-phosphatidyltransferase/cardiolipin synthase